MTAAGGASRRDSEKQATDIAGPTGAGAGREAGAVPDLVLGTAGHIDHGKTALVRALTGVDTDRLPEERARGITIDLGFAALDLPGGLRLGVVDVPGHERLVRTMVSGATGIDLVLVVVAADEGVMPQTREHLAICELLGLTRGAVAITKCDLVDEDVAALAAEEVRELLAATPLADAPVCRVSAVRGEGVEALREALAEAARRAAPRTPRAGAPRLPVDRVFAMKGFGTVVTGTLVGAPLAAGDPVQLFPSGRRARVRGLQTHGAAVGEVRPGSRCAANLQGVEVADVSRGDVVSAPEALVPTRVLDARVRWLPGAPRVAARASIELLAGTAERRARLLPIGGGAVEPGESAFARIHVEGPPLPLLPGDRFVLRGFSRIPGGGATFGGGLVLDPAPPRRRRSDRGLARELETLQRFDTEAEVAVRIARAGLTGISARALRHQMGVERRALERCLETLGRDGRAARTSGGAWLGAGALEDLERRVIDALDAFHEREPLRPGMPRAPLRGALPENVKAASVDLVVERLVQSGDVIADRDVVRRASHRPELSGDERRAAEHLRQSILAAGLDPPSLRDLAARVNLPLERVRDLAAHLEREGELVRARELFFDREAVDALRERVLAHLHEHGELDTPTYKSLIGTTRRAAVPLMELFDDEKLTLRRGDTRLLRGTRGRW